MEIDYFTIIVHLKLFFSLNNLPAEFLGKLCVSGPRRIDGVLAIDENQHINTSILNINTPILKFGCQQNWGMVQVFHFTDLCSRIWPQTNL